MRCAHLFPRSLLLPSNSSQSHFSLIYYLIILAFFIFCLWDLPCPVAIWWSKIYNLTTFLILHLFVFGELILVYPSGSISSWKGHCGDDSFILLSSHFDRLLWSISQDGWSNCSKFIPLSYLFLAWDIAFVNHIY